MVLLIVHSGKSSIEKVVFFNTISNKWLAACVVLTQIRIVVAEFIMVVAKFVGGEQETSVENRKVHAWTN